MLHLTVNLTAVSYDGTKHLTGRAVILRRQRLYIGIDLPVFLIQVEFRNDVNELHIRFPVGRQRTNILPVAVKLIGKQPLTLISAIRNDVLAKIKPGSILVGLQRLFKCFPGENINSHGCQIAARVGRLLFKICNLPVFIGNHDAESLGLFHRNRHNSNGHVRIILLVEVQHGFIVHLINVIAGKDQNIVRMVIFHIAHVLIYGVGRPGIPLCPRDLLIGRKHRYTACQLVQIPRNTNADMCIQLQRHILRQHSHGIHTGINAVAQGKIDDSIFTPKGNCRLCHLGCKNAKTAAAASCQQHRYHFLLDHHDHLSAVCICLWVFSHQPVQYSTAGHRIKGISDAQLCLISKFYVFAAAHFV